MNSWTTIRLAYPAADLDLANRAGAILDPDTGGDRTFDGRTMLIGGEPYIYADIPMQAPKPAIVQARDPAVWYAVLAELAVAKGLEPMTLAECQHLCAVAKCGEECMADDPPAPEPEPEELESNG